MVTAAVGVTAEMSKVSAVIGESNPVAVVPHPAIMGKDVAVLKRVSDLILA